MVRTGRERGVWVEGVLTGVLPVVKWTPSLVSTAFVMSFTMLGLSLIRIAEVVLGFCSSDCLVVT